MTETTPSPLSDVITIDDERIKSHLDRVVRGSVEETLNALLDAEADRLCNAQRYERSEARRDTRAGHYERRLHTKAGEVRLKVPKLRQQTFETAIIERYRRRESSVEEALIEMYPSVVVSHANGAVGSTFYRQRIRPGAQYRPSSDQPNAWRTHFCLREAWVCGWIGWSWDDNDLVDSVVG